MHILYLDKVGQAQIDAPRLLWDLRVADGNVRHDGQHQRLERLVETVGKALGPGHLKRHRDKQIMINRISYIKTLMNCKPLSPESKSTTVQR